MKKNRPAIMLTCMCAKEDREKFLTLILKHTTTLGVREYNCKTLWAEKRNQRNRNYIWNGSCQSCFRIRYCKGKPEYEDMARIAKEKNISLSEVEKEIYKKLSENKAR